ncbi:MAG TPA: thioredoxin domain-containing protein [Nitrospiria bacterium]
MEKTLFEIDDDSFEVHVIKAKGKVLVDFWSPRCASCKGLEKELILLKDEIGDILEIVKINVDDNPLVRGEFEILHLPTLGLFENGEFVRFIGGIGKKEFLKEELGFN